ncbi:MAG: alcohol dehydrogenase catalytic domain-containing protein, partial [Rubrivivax sp.]
MSRAWVCTELSEDLSGLHLQQRPLPTCGPGQLSVDVHAAALNFPDLLMTRGRYQLKPPLPFVVGMEGAGVVRSVGPDVKDWTTGQRVCFSTRHGAF